jgi:fatty-acyl-CoA synthase
MKLPLTPLRFKRRVAQLYGRKLGVVCGELRYSYHEFVRRCDQLSHAIVSLGGHPGDRVAFLAYNCHRLLEAYYGVVQMGGVLLPLNIRLSKEDFTYILNDSKTRVLFFDIEFKDIVDQIRPRLDTVKTFVPLDAPAFDDWAVAQTYDQLLHGAASTPFQGMEADEDEVAEIFYTSGTTANPKGVMLTHRNLYLHALTAVIALGLRDSDIQLHTIPLFHVNGWGAPQTVTCVGGTHVMIKKFDPAVVLQLLQKEQVTVVAMVPTMATALLNHSALRAHTYSSLRMVNVGGAAPSPEMITKLEEAFGAPCYTGYGLTETSPLMTVATLKSTLGTVDRSERLRRQAMTGWPQIGVEVRVVDENNQDVKPDGQEIGEIIVRGDSVMKGYWRQPEETARVMRDGFFHTGDMATVDEEGYLLIVDRKKDIIISGGENIASIEVEKCLSAHPAVLECAVIAVPDAKWGEVPKGLVVLKDGVPASEQELLDFCSLRLAAFKCPRSIDFYDSLPKGGTGKILKRTLREKYWAGEDKRVHG